MRPRFWAALLTVTAVLLIVAAGCVKERDGGGKSSDGNTPQAQAGFVGSEACAPCHQKQFDAVHASNHAKTLTRMTPETIGKLAPPPGPVGTTGYALRQEGDGYQWEYTGTPEKSMKLDLALGSGKTGVTYVRLTDANTVDEIRYTYFPQKKVWELTPGQESAPEGSLSRARINEAARKCIECHAVTAPPPNTLMPPTAFLGVGCESCHGPGGAHVKAASSGDFATAAMEKFGTLKASRINEVCGKCHVSFGQVNQQSDEAFATHRFTAYGLMKSECFLRSDDRLSCVTCHDPHTNASRDAKTYIAACISCHTPANVAKIPDHSKQMPSPAAIASKTCPINPRDKCLDCHMPRRLAFKDSRIGTRLTDHYIRIWMPDELKAATGAK